MIYRETEGNPFFVEEVFQHLWEEQRLFDKDGNWIDGIAISELDVPAGVRLVIGRRLDRLKEAAARVLRAAAVIGRVFDPRVLELIDSLDPEDVLDAIEEAEAARLITTTMGDQYSFTHELIRQTLMAQQSLLRRQRMHLQIAGALEKSLGARAEEKAIDIANHLVRAWRRGGFDEDRAVSGPSGRQRACSGRSQRGVPLLQSGPLPVPPSG